MSVSGLGLVREVYDAYARRDMPAVFALLHPDVEIRQTELVPWAAITVGSTASGRSPDGSWRRPSRPLTIERLIDAGDHVAAVGRTRGHLRASGAPFDAAVVHVWTVRDGRLAGLDVYIDTPAMREALGPG